MTTQAEYNRIADTHGRRVANRVILAETPPEARTLDDFHGCYGPEASLPESERGKTTLVQSFDPTGRNVHYAYEPPPVVDVDENGNDCFWPEPEAAPRVAAADRKAEPTVTSNATERLAAGRPGHQEAERR